MITYSFDEVTVAVGGREFVWRSDARGDGGIAELPMARQPLRVVPPNVGRREYRRFLKALRKKQKQARCRGYSP